MKQIQYLFFVFLILFVYQNCGNVNLQAQKELSSSSGQSSAIDSTVDFCIRKSHSIWDMT